MGYKVYYRSTKPVAPKQAAAIHTAAEALIAGRTWLSCEPVWLYDVEADGYLLGGSKPNFDPHPDDAAAAAREGLPDGTLQDVVDILCRLSRDFGVDWAFSDDYRPGPIGFIRDGVCDQPLTQMLEGINLLVSEFAVPSDSSDRPDSDVDGETDLDDEQDPPILRFPSPPG